MGLAGTSGASENPTNANQRVSLSRLQQTTFVGSSCFPRVLSFLLLVYACTRYNQGHNDHRSMIRQPQQQNTYTTVVFRAQRYVVGDFSRELRCSTHLSRLPPPMLPPSPSSDLSPSFPLRSDKGTQQDEATESVRTMTRHNEWLNID